MRVSTPVTKVPGKRFGSMVTINISVRQRALAIISIWFVAISWLTAQEQPRFDPPADSKVVNVKDFGAIGDGKTDDTAAIRAAIEANIDKNRYAAPAFYYFPPGTYVLSGPVEGRAADRKGWSAGWRSGVILIGQSRESVILRLKDSTEGYADVANPRYVIATGSEDDTPNESGRGNRAFRNSVINMTIDLGRGNPGAVGIDYMANNRGVIENVLIKGGKDSGWCGVRMDRDWPGPALIKGLEVQGCDWGVRMDNHWEFSMTFEDLTLRDQRVGGFYVKNNAAFIRHLTSVNTVPAIIAKDDNNSMVVVLDANITNPGGGNAPGLALQGLAYVRNLTCTGYAVAIDDLTERNQDVAGDAKKTVKINEYRSGPVVSTSGDQPVALNLPVEETPLYWPKSAAEWMNGTDDLQAAVDSGKPVVYLPAGGYTFEKTLIIRGGKLRKLVGMQSAIGFPKEKSRVAIRFEGDAKSSVILEHLWIDGLVEHVGAGTLTLRHCDLNSEPVGLIASGPGKTFIEDVIGRWTIGAGHRLWARQTNAEFGEVPLLNINGGTAWILGFKTEGNNVCLHMNGGSAELLGGLFYTFNFDGRPAIEVDSGNFSGSWVYSRNRRNLPVRERQDGGEWTDCITGFDRGVGLFSTKQATKQATQPAADQSKP